MQMGIIGSKNMTVSEMINQAIKAKNVQKKDVAAKMNWSQQNFANRLANGTIDAEEWKKIAKILGYEIQMVDLSTNAILKPRRASGPRVVKSIEGYTYDTDKADALCRTPKIAGSWFELFKDIASGQFFTVAYLETSGSACMATISKENAKQFYDDCGGEGCEGYFQ